MKKIMFNDKYGLTQAVLDGRKTMTRRMIRHRDSYEGKEFGFYHYRPGTLETPNQYNFVELLDADEFHYDTERYARSEFKVCEVVGIAMSYKELINRYAESRRLMMAGAFKIKDEFIGAGFKNKMFVNPIYMPNQIMILGIRVEPLQNISDEDCLREGISEFRPETITDDGVEVGELQGYTFQGGEIYATPREAFAALIDKVSGKGTWEDNPLVWVYEFELIDKAV